MINSEAFPTPAWPALGRSVSIEQAARLMDVSRRTVYNRIRDGRLRTVRTLGGSQRVLLESLPESVKAVYFEPPAVQAAART